MNVCIAQLKNLRSAGADLGLTRGSSAIEYFFNLRNTLLAFPATTVEPDEFSRALEGVYVRLVPTGAKEFGFTLLISATESLNPMTSIQTQVMLIALNRIIQLAVTALSQDEEGEAEEEVEDDRLPVASTSAQTKTRKSKSSNSRTPQKTPPRTPRRRLSATEPSVPYSRTNRLRPSPSSKSVNYLDSSSSDSDQNVINSLIPTNAAGETIVTESGSKEK